MDELLGVSPHVLLSQLKNNPSAVANLIRWLAEEAMRQTFDG